MNRDINERQLHFEMRLPYLHDLYNSHRNLNEKCDDNH